MAVLCRFDELRVKTDKELLQVVNNTLDRGVREVSHALKSYDNRAVATDHHHRANAAYDEAARLIPLIGQIVGEERSGVEAKLAHLKKMLEAFTTAGPAPTPSEDQIAALARALWNARGCPEGLPDEDWFRAERVLRRRGECHAACVGR
jgi:hypothetical protein